MCNVPSVAQIDLRPPAQEDVTVARALALTAVGVLAYELRAGRIAAGATGGCGG